MAELYTKLFVDTRMPPHGRLLASVASLLAGSVRQWTVQTNSVEADSSELQTARDDAGKRPVGDAVRYIQARLSLMNYTEARRRGLPIGSGAVEATGKSLVSVRMKRYGSRWKHQSGNEILQLRALHLGDRWDAAMPRILCPLRKPRLRGVDQDMRYQTAAKCLQ